ncbi:MAG: hypothetical protein ACLUNQ_04320 [Oscillospiraceae bacterium]
MVGFRTADDVVFLADCLSSREILEKYQVGFIYDVAEYLHTLEMVKDLQARMFVPAHAEASENMADLARYNIDKVLEVAEKILTLCPEPRCFEEILQGLFAAFAMKMDFQQYVLVGSTLRSYLAWLKDAGRVQVTFADNRMLWQRVCSL